MKRKAIWWLRVGLLALAGAPGCVRYVLAPKEPGPCECPTPYMSCPSCATAKPATEARQVSLTTVAPVAPAASAVKPMQLPPLPTPAPRAPAAPPADTVVLPESNPAPAAAAKPRPELTASPKPAAPDPVVVTPARAVAPAPVVKAPAPPAVASKPKVRLILTGTEVAPARPAAPVIGPQIPSHLPDLDLPAPAEGKPAVKANKEEEGPPLFPDEPAVPSGVELAVAKGPEGPGRAVHAYLPAEAKPDVPALRPMPPVAPAALPAAAGPKAPARPIQLPDPPHENRLLFPRRETGPARRSYTDVTAAPCFAHAKDYGWLCGRVEYSRLSKGWRLRYASVDKPDRFGGSVTLAPDSKLDALKEGQYVRVNGRLADGAAGLSPPYEVESLTPVAHPNDPQSADAGPDEF
jgi:hypothetical protein